MNFSYNCTQKILKMKKLALILIFNLAFYFANGILTTSEFCIRKSKKCPSDYSHKCGLKYCAQHKFKCDIFENLAFILRRFSALGKYDQRMKKFNAFTRNIELCH